MENDRIVYDDVSGQEVAIRYYFGRGKSFPLFHFSTSPLISIVLPFLFNSLSHFPLYFVDYQSF